MLEIKNLSITLTKNDRKLIESFDFSLQHNDKVVLIGEEGNGKSTLLKCMVDQDMIEPYAQVSGVIRRKGIIGYLPQQMDVTEQSLSIHQYLSSVDLYPFLNELNHIGLSFDLLQEDRLIATLSGGERIKVQLAKLLCQKCDVLLLDEPTNDLDIEALQWLESFINTSNIPVLYISHDEMLIEKTANRIIHIEQLKRKSVPKITIVSCNYHEYLENRLHLLKRQDQIATKQRDEHKQQMDKWRQIYERVNHEQKTITRQDPSKGRLLKKKMKSVKSMGKRFEKQEEGFVEFADEEKAIITRFDSNISLPNGKVTLEFSLAELTMDQKVLSKNINLLILGNQHIGIIGTNGVGKTTLLKKIFESMQNRTDVIPYYMSQTYEEVMPFQQSVIEFLVPSRHKDDITKVRTYLGNMRFTQQEMTGTIESLSGGQKAKVLFLDMVLKKANVLLLDEPTRNFSPLSAPIIRESLQEFKGAILTVTHDRKYLQQVCETVYQLTPMGLIPFSNIYEL